MKKLLSMVAIAGLVLFFACGGGGDDPKTVMNEYIDIMDDYVAAMGKAGSADDIVSAVEKAAVKLKAMAPKIKAVNEKHPELANMKPGAKLPEEFKEIEERMTKFVANMGAAMANAQKYMQDPKVIEAMKKLGEAMAGIK